MREAAIAGNARHVACTLQSRRRGPSFDGTGLVNRDENEATGKEGSDGMEVNVRSVKDTASDTVEKLEPRDESLDRVKRHAGRVREDLRELGRAAGDAGREKIGDARDAARELYDRGLTRAVETRDGVERTLRSHPFRSVAIAAAGGAALGVLLTGWLSRRGGRRGDDA